MPTLKQLRSIHEDDLRACFSWLTRIGVSPKFGTLPIQYYQQHQIAAMNAIEKACFPLPDDTKLRCHGEEIWAGKVCLGTTKQFYLIAARSF